MILKTNICCLNISSCIVEYLKKEHSIYDGYLGNEIDLTLLSRGSHYLLSTHDFPSNIQEYDVFVIDLANRKPILYDKQDHTRQYVGDGSNIYFLSETNQTIFDTIPFGASLLKENLIKNRTKKPIVIIFQEKKQESTYHFVDKISTYDYRDKGIKKYSNYNFSDSLPLSNVLYGKRVNRADNNLSKILFDGIENKLQYHQLFYHTEKYNSDTKTYGPSSNILPLLYSQNNDLVSFVQIEENEPIYIVLPQAEDDVKLKIIQQLFEKVLYEKFSNYFPYVENTKWIHNNLYKLPGVQEIETKIEEAYKEFVDKENILKQEIVEIESKFDFLQKIITTTGEELVQAMIEYLKWLGFKNVIEKDSFSDGVFEEDIQVDLEEDGLLIIEVKGIYGTSKDSECSQIEKIKHRREKERKKWDVYALYVVNHQRGIEPTRRENLPFNSRQIEDAISDERGLLTTWQLYSIFHAIELGVITKEKVRKDILQYGNVSFTPDLVCELNKPYQQWKEGIIWGLEINTPISVQDKIFVVKDGCWSSAEIISIQQEKISYQTISNGKVGIELSQKLPSGKIYLKHIENNK